MALTASYGQVTIPRYDLCLQQQASWSRCAVKTLKLAQTAAWVDASKKMCHKKWELHIIWQRLNKNVRHKESLHHLVYMTHGPWSTCHPPLVLIDRWWWQLTTERCIRCKTVVQVRALISDMVCMVHSSQLLFYLNLSALTSAIKVSAKAIDAILDCAQNVLVCSQFWCTPKIWVLCPLCLTLHTKCICTYCHLSPHIAQSSASPPHGQWTMYRLYDVCHVW